MQDKKYKEIDRSAKLSDLKKVLGSIITESDAMDYFMNPVIDNEVEKLMQKRAAEGKPKRKYTPKKAANGKETSVPSNLSIDSPSLASNSISTDLTSL